MHLYSNHLYLESVNLHMKLCGNSIISDEISKPKNI